jgi:SAM-dependent methyltransferase
VQWDVAADAYESFMGRYSRFLSPQMAEFAGVAPGQRVLDVGSGPGVLTRELVERIGAEAVTAADPSESFVEAARRTLPGVRVVRTAAEDLPFDDGEFDAAIAQLVVHFMTDPVAGLTEMRRVTRRGGTVAACVWDFDGGQAPLSAFWRVARELDPEVIDESRLNGAREGHLVELFEAAGVRDVEPATMTVSLEHSSFEDWWEPYTRGVGPAGMYVATLDDAHRDELRERCRERMPAGPFTLTSRAWAARGTA